jgi:hypothetical protein
MGNKLLYTSQGQHVSLTLFLYRMYARRTLRYIGKSLAGVPVAPRGGKVPVRTWAGPHERKRHFESF